MTATGASRPPRTGAVRLLITVLVVTMGLLVALGGVSVLVTPATAQESPAEPTTDATASPNVDAPAPDVDAPAYDDVVDLTFPVNGPTSYGDSYPAPRGGGTRVHKASDIMTDYGTGVHAAMGGEVSWITGIDKAVPHYGYMLSIDGDDGRRYSYIHLGRQDQGPESAYLPGIVRGARVERGQQIGWAGCSGNASCSAPHLHFEIEDETVTDPYGSHRMNPYASLLDAERRGDLPDPRQTLLDPCAASATVPETPVRRVSGGDPVATSVAVSATGWASATEAVIATSGDFADALAGAAFASERDAPLFLVGASLASTTAGELDRLGADKVTILGGPNAVAPEVQVALEAIVPVVERVAGSDRFATAAAISERLTNTGAEIALALGRHADPQRSWPDAIAAGALAGGDQTVPVLLSETDELPAETVSQLIRARESGVTKVLVIGGPEAIEAHVDKVIADLGLTVQRLAGENRYATSLAVAQAAAARSAVAPDTLVVASGESFVDALPAGPLAARAGGSLLLVPPCNLRDPSHVGAYVAGRYVDGYVVGARSAVSESVREVLTNAMAD